MICSVAVIGVGAHSAAAAPAVGASKIAGSYAMTFTWRDAPPGTADVTLRRDHSGNDHFPGSTVRWSTSGRSITIVFTLQSPSITATYLGTVTKTGLNRVGHPGTMSNDLGQTGTWYAVKTG
jgi:hypothetical protein